MNFNLLNIFRKQFGLKVFSVFALFMLVLSFSLTFFFYRHQSRALTDSLIQDNLLLAGILAHNSRIGVFSENEELLQNSVEAVFRQEETEEVSIYDAKGNRLLDRDRAGINSVPEMDYAGMGIETGLLNLLRKAKAPFYRERANKMYFWSPITASSGYREAEALYFQEGSPHGKERLIGFVRITVGKTALNRRLKNLLLNSVLIGIFFLIAGSGIIYFAVRRVVNPLKTLTKGVQTVGAGNFGAAVPVETEDEIGELAAAFNQMSQSLLMREEEKGRLEEQLRNSQRMEAIGTLAGGIAHDFNNILGVIMGYAQLALLTDTGERDNRSIREVYQASLRARDLIKQIITFSRQGYQERVPLLMAPIVKEALKMAAMSLPARIEVRRNLQEGLSPVLSDPTQIHQVVMNLCTNAGHAMPDGGVLDVTLLEVEMKAADAGPGWDMAPGRYQLLTVSDTGHGMEEAIRKRIFDPFFTTKGPGKGTGMGLSVVHGIVKTHGGKIVCRSEPGRGTVFEIYFPTINEEPLRRPEPAASPPSGKERLLFVDDEEALVDIARQMLQGLGYSVVGRTSSVEALEAFRSHPDHFDLIITDNSMPNMSGMELAEKVRHISPRLPVILCTGFSEGLTEDNIKALGFAGLLMKPIIREELALLVRRALEERSAKE